MEKKKYYDMFTQSLAKELNENGSTIRNLTNIILIDKCRQTSLIGPENIGTEPSVSVYYVPH